MPVTINGSGLASGVTSVPNLQSFPIGPRLDGANMPVGSVLQVVQGVLSSQQGMTASSFTNTNLTATITPKFSTSKILIMVNAGVQSSTSNCNFTVYRNGTTNLGNGGVGFGYLTGGGGSINVSLTPAYLDSPATTSATTYAFYVSVAGGTVYVCNGAATSTITLMEIAG